MTDPTLPQPTAKPESPTPVSEEDALPAGELSSWIAGTIEALENDTGAAVACGDCTACCTSAYFVHIGPEETATLARIPPELVFPAPGLPEGNVVLGYDETGHCPMLAADRCSIYEDRPLTCRRYDCRVFAAADVQTEEAEKALIDERARRWRFDYANARSRAEHAAIRRAARFLVDHASCFPRGFLPSNATQRAILALELHGVLLDEPARGAEQDAPERSPEEIAQAMVEARAQLEARRAASKSRRASTAERATHP